MLGRFVFLRLRRALLPDFQRLWTRDVSSAVGDLTRRLQAVERELADLRAFRRDALRRQWAAERAPLLAEVSRIDLNEVRAHIAAAVGQAALMVEPTAYMVVDDVLPPRIYDLLSAAIPPIDCFPDRDPVKRDVEMAALAEMPELTRRMWRLFDEDIVGAIVAPLVLDRFGAAIVRHYADTGGEAFGEKAAAIPHRTFAGRIQLRRPGYHLAPHLDPKRVVVTGLFYFPRPGDTEDFGTRLYSVDRPVVSSGMSTFFPEQTGAVCTVARSVPYRPNSMLVFVNSRAAHGAGLPHDAPLDERYTYQFYVKPIDGHLKKVLRELPPDAREAWKEML